jgi:hypothetical protein
MRRALFEGSQPLNNLPNNPYRGQQRLIPHSSKILILDVSDLRIKTGEELVSWLENLQQTEPSLINQQNAGQLWYLQLQIHFP